MRKNIAGLVMNVDDVQKLVDCKETWSSVEEEVRRTVQGSDAGQRIFGLAFRCVEDERVMASIKASLQTLLTKPITLATVAVERQSFAKLIASHGSDASKSFNKREMTILHRSTRVPILVHSYGEQHIYSITAL